MKTLEEQVEELKKLHAEMFAGKVSPLFIDKKIDELVITAEKRERERWQQNPLYQRIETALKEYKAEAAEKSSQTYDGHKARIAISVLETITNLTKE